MRTPGLCALVFALAACSAPTPPPSPALPSSLDDALALERIPAERFPPSIEDENEASVAESPPASPAPDPGPCGDGKPGDTSPRFLRRCVSREGHPDTGFCGSRALRSVRTRVLSNVDDDTRGALVRASEALRACQDLRVSFTGSADAWLVLDTTGSVVSIDVQKLEDECVAACVARVFRAARLPARRAPERVEISIRFQITNAF